MGWGVLRAPSEPMEIPGQGCKRSPSSQTGELSSPQSPEAAPSSCWTKVPQTSFLSFSAKAQGSALLSVGQGFPHLLQSTFPIPGKVGEWAVGVQAVLHHSHQTGAAFQTE